VEGRVGRGLGGQGRACQEESCSEEEDAGQPEGYAFRAAGTGAQEKYRRPPSEPPANYQVTAGQRTVKGWGMWQLGSQGQGVGSCC